jgi:hypothetical protein
MGIGDGGRAGRWMKLGIGFRDEVIKWMLNVRDYARFVPC